MNNAGIAEAGTALDIGEADWREVLDINLNSVWFLAQEAGRRMVEGGAAGTIINVASMLGMRVLPGTAHYNVAKAGVIHMTRSLAIELARHSDPGQRHGARLGEKRNDRSLSQKPEGRSDAQGDTAGRVGEPSDLDGVLLLLASAKASGFMTGSTIAVDGGHMWSFV